MNQGDIVLVPFPYTDLSATKTRPALIISKTKYPEDVILVAITSKKNESGLQIEDADLANGLLPLISFIRIDKVVTLKKSIIKKRVAILKPGACSKIVAKFKMQF